MYEEVRRNRITMANGYIMVDKNYYAIGKNLKYLNSLLTDQHFIQK